MAITKVLRDGILRIGQKSLKLVKEHVDEWFTNQSNFLILLLLLLCVLKIPEKLYNSNTVNTLKDE